jgi:hypothetical protein
MEYGECASKILKAEMEGQEVIAAVGKLLSVGDVVLVSRYSFEIAEGLSAFAE